MLKQLRWKITGLIMSVVVILLTAIFLALYCLNRAELPKSQYGGNANGTSTESERAA